MKKLINIILVILIVFCSTNATLAKGRKVKSSSRSHIVHSYVTKRGTYVRSHVRSNPDKSKWNNYSAKGNYNPYTGKNGKKKAY